MTLPRDGAAAPVDPFEDVPRILKAMRKGVHEALLRHKRLGNPVAVWRDGRAVWLQPEEIPAEMAEPSEED